MIAYSIIVGFIAFGFSPGIDALKEKVISNVVLWQ
jgi:hypothetical protein